jgi:predicted nucleic-acid-binding protein
MIGVDTNILLRTLLQDDAKQLARARAFFATCTKERPAYISLVTLIETAWVMQKLYGLSKLETVAQLEILMKAENLALQDEDAVAMALQTYADTKIDFADALIAAVNQQHGCEKTVSFDRTAIKSGVMAAL